jgi:hypothetical protein
MTDVDTPLEQLEVVVFNPATLSAEILPLTAFLGALASHPKASTRSR